MRSPILLAALGATLLAAAPAHADPTLHAGLGSEMGRGLGLGVELGEGTTLVVGAGLGGHVGWSSIAGWETALAPGVAAGVRHYLGGWYLGASIGLNATLMETGLLGPSRRGDLDASAMLDLGYRWRVGADDGSVIRLGLGIGTQRAINRSDDLEPALALTLSFGW